MSAGDDACDMWPCMPETPAAVIAGVRVVTTMAGWYNIKDKRWSALVVSMLLMAVATASSPPPETLVMVET